MNTGVIEEIRKTAGGNTSAFLADENSAGQFDSPNHMVAGSMATLVKGAGYARVGGNAPLTDDGEIFKRSMRAEMAFTKAIKGAIADPGAVLKGMNPDFANQFGSFLSANPQTQMLNQWVGGLQAQISDAIGKNITLTTPLSTGLVPFDLAAPSRLIYPVYSPIRNKLPRVKGQGTSRRAKIITGVSGTQTGSSGGKFVDLGIPELVTGSGSMQNWPLNLPGSGSQDSVDINVPYKFWGLTESLSWLAQFAGQGFEDVSALANLILLQEFMLNEEAAHIAATSVPLTTPGAPVLLARTANTGEAALTGITTNIFVKVSGANWYGETAASTGATLAWSAGQVVDVTVSPVGGAQWYNIYVTHGATAGTYYRMQANVGSQNFTLQGAIPTTGTVPPVADTGTSSPNRQEGMISTLTGHSAGVSAVYPAGWQGGYVNQSVGDTLNHNVMNTALQQMWDGTGAFRADPSELIAEGGDVMRMSNDIVNVGSNNNAYRLFVEQSEIPGVRLGAAVSEFQNPITRSPIRVVVHPWLNQGTAMLQSYTLPFAWSNTSNVWEFTTVQDYLSISWPVIDASFRYSMFMYGALVANAPQYCGILQGLQQTDRSGTTGTWS